MHVQKTKKYSTWRFGKTFSIVSHYINCLPWLGFVVDSTVSNWDPVLFLCFQPWHLLICHILYGFLPPSPDHPDTWKHNNTEKPNKAAVVELWGILCTSEVSSEAKSTPVKRTYKTKNVTPSWNYGLPSHCPAMPEEGSPGSAPLLLGLMVFFAAALFALNTLDFVLAIAATQPIGTARLAGFCEKAPKQPPFLNSVICVLCHFVP